MRLSELNTLLEGQRLGRDVSFPSVSIDSRTLRAGDLYVALRGDRYDGHDFVAAAEAAGAVATLVERRVETACPQVIVSDTRKALGDLAAAWRWRYGLPVVAVTGSNGKTTVKEMVAAILEVEAEVLATRGNLNNEIGVPLTLLSLRPAHRFAVIEMGANHPGEIAYCSRCAQPDVAVITNAGAAHLEGFGGLEGVARAKGELLTYLAAEGCAILNADDRHYGLWRELAGARRVLSFGFSAAAQIRAEDVVCRVENGRFRTSFLLCRGGERWPLTLSLCGRHNVANALAAAAAALALGLGMAQIQAGLERVKPVLGRMQPLTGRAGALVINDSYNGNPSSLRAALEVLVALQGRPWLVLGAFAELGAGSAELHREIGRDAKTMGVERLFATGRHAEQVVAAFGDGGEFFQTQAALIDSVEAALEGDVVLLVKGSRSQKMERVVEALCVAESF